MLSQAAYRIRQCVQNVRRYKQCLFVGTVILPLFAYDATFIATDVKVVSI